MGVVSSPGPWAFAVCLACGKGSGAQDDGSTSNGETSSESGPAETSTTDESTNDGPSWGISVDVQNFLRLIETGGAPTKAFKIDTETYDYEFFDNPARMYTYSDMTGFGLANVADPAG